MNHIVIEDKINGKTVRCIFIFKKYSEKEFKEDFEEFVQFQKEKKPRGDYVDYHLYNIDKFQEIPFSSFVKYSTELFSKAIFYLLRQRQDIILSDELNIQIFLRRIKNWDYSFDTIKKAVNEENACFISAGMWFLNNIVAPYFYLRKFEFTIIIRYFLHELTHYVDITKKHWGWELNRNYEKKIQKIVGRKSAYGINYLYSSLFGLRLEGFADFIARIESPEIDIDGDSIRKYNHNLEKLAFMRYKKDAFKFYSEIIEYGNLTPSGEYATGRNMCLFIAMAYAKEMHSPFSIRVNKDKFFGFKFDKLDHYLSKGVKIYVSGLHKDVIDKAVRDIRSTEHYYFLKLYEKACDVLGISDKNKAMTQRRFYNLVKEAKEASKNKNKRLIEKEGFVYVQSELKLDV